MDDRMLELKRYNGEIDWNVGTLFQNSEVFIAFMQRLKSERVMSNIKYSFGCYACKWNSGRLIREVATSMKALTTAIDIYNSYGINVRFTFSNHLITEEDLHDVQCNATLEYMDMINAKNSSLENGVIISSDLLREYIRKNYPHVRITSSLYKPGIETKFVTDSVNYYNDLLDKFDVVVVDSNKVKDKNISFLKGLKDKSRVEFIANNSCIRHCPNIQKHDIAVSKLQRAMCENNEEQIKELLEEIQKYISYCDSVHASDDAGSRLDLSKDEIDMLIDLGFKHFKIEGRERSKEFLFAALHVYVFNETMD